MRVDVEGEGIMLQHSQYNGNVSEDMKSHTTRNVKKHVV
jgi:hypothetical protein